MTTSKQHNPATARDVRTTEINNMWNWLCTSDDTGEKATKYKLLGFWNRSQAAALLHESRDTAVERPEVQGDEPLDVPSPADTASYQEGDIEKFFGCWPEPQADVCGRLVEAEKVIDYYRYRDHWQSEASNGSGSIDFRQKIIFLSGPCDGYDPADRYRDKFPDQFKTAEVQADVCEADLPDAQDIAQFFHYTYERLAPQFGYETRVDTKQFDPESANGKLMIAVCSVVLSGIRKPARKELADLDRENEVFVSAWAFFVNRYGEPATDGQRNHTQSYVKEMADFALQMLRDHGRDERERVGAELRQIHQTDGACPRYSRNEQCRMCAVVDKLLSEGTSK